MLFLSNGRLIFFSSKEPFTSTSWCKKRGPLLLTTLRGPWKKLPLIFQLKLSFIFYGKWDRGPYWLFFGGVLKRALIFFYLFIYFFHQAPSPFWSVCEQSLRIQFLQWQKQFSPVASKYFMMGKQIQSEEYKVWSLLIVMLWV